MPLVQVAVRNDNVKHQHEVIHADQHRDHVLSVQGSRRSRTYALSQFKAMGIIPVGLLGSGGCGDIFAVVKSSNVSEFIKKCMLHSSNRKCTRWSRGMIIAAKIILSSHGITQQELHLEHLVQRRMASKYPRAIPVRHMFDQSDIERFRNDFEISDIQLSEVFPDGDCAQWIEKSAVHHRFNFAQQVSITCSVVIQIAASLAMYHACDIVHCDVKLENVLVDCESGATFNKNGQRHFYPRVVLSDTDTAIPGGRHGVYTHCMSSNVDDLCVADSTRASLACTLQRPGCSLERCRRKGTWLDWAPEIARHAGGHPRTWASDIWSLGVLIWCMLHGTHPFDDDELTDEECISNIVDVKCRTEQMRMVGDDTEANTALNELISVCGRCMRVSPYDRPRAIELATNCVLKSFALKYSAECSHICREHPVMTPFRSLVHRIHNSLVDANIQNCAQACNTNSAT